MRWVAAGGLRVIDVPDVAKGDIAALQARYLDRPMDVADATLLWAAAALEVSDILTIDEAGFSAYRTPAGKRLHNRFFVE